MAEIFDSHNESVIGSIIGDGDFRYHGFGVLGKLNFLNGFFMDASVKAGQIHSEYKNSQNWEYDTTRSYTGAHIGLGKELSINENSNLELYSRAFFLRVAKKDIVVNSDELRIGASKSLRARVGAKFNYNLTQKLEAYLGAAYEREFKGEAKGYNKTHNQNIASPSIKGGSGIANLGVKVDVTDKFSVDLKFEGMIGKKEGVSGAIAAVYKF